MNARVTEHQEELRRHLRAHARGWLRTLGRKPKDTVTLKLSAETAAMAMFLMDVFGGFPEKGDAGNVRWRLRYLLGSAAHSGKAHEHRGRGFFAYSGPKKAPR